MPDRRLESVDPALRRLHERHMHRHLNYLIGANAPPKAGMKEMFVLCAGYWNLHNRIIERKDHQRHNTTIVATDTQYAITT